MKTLTVIEFNRSEVIKSSEDKPIEEISIVDFPQPYNLSLQRAHSVLFRDDDGRVKVLKDRYRTLYVPQLGTIRIVCSNGMVSADASLMDGPMIPPIKIEKDGTH